MIFDLNHRLNHIIPMHYSAKFFWAMAPLLWGATNWFFAFGAGSCYPINYVLRTLFWVILAVYSLLEYARKHYIVTIFNYQLYLPSWCFLIVIPVVLIVFAQYLYMPSSAVLQSFIYGVFVSSLFEELITRSYFVKYRMSIIEFLFFNIISSVAFSLMHAGFVATPLLYIRPNA